MRRGGGGAGPRRRGGAGPAHRGAGGAVGSEGPERERACDCAPLFRSRTHGKDFFLFFCFQINLCRVPQILAHGKQINFAVCPNLGTRQILTTSTAGPHGAMFAVCLTEAHGKMWRRWPTGTSGHVALYLPCAEVWAHSEASFRRGLYFGRVFCIWPTTKAFFAVCPMVCARRTFRHTANWGNLVVIRYHWFLLGEHVKWQSWSHKQCPCCSCWS